MVEGREFCTVQTKDGGLRMTTRDGDYQWPERLVMWSERLMDFYLDPPIWAKGVFFMLVAALVAFCVVAVMVIG